MAMPLRFPLVLPPDLFPGRPGLQLLHHDRKCARYGRCQTYCCLVLNHGGQLGDALDAVGTAAKVDEATQQSGSPARKASSLMGHICRG